MAKKVAKKATPKKVNKFSQMMLAAETVKVMDEILKDVKDSKSSVFSKDDVIKIISEIKGTFKQESPTLLINLDEFVDELADNITDNIDQGDLDDFELDLDGSEIFIRGIRLDNQRVKELIEGITDQYFA